MSSNSKSGKHVYQKIKSHRFLCHPYRSWEFHDHIKYQCSGITVPNGRRFWRALIWRCHHCVEKRWKLFVRTPSFGITACDMKGGRGFSANRMWSHLHTSNSLLDETTTKKNILVFYTIQNDVILSSHNWAFQKLMILLFFPPSIAFFVYFFAQKMTPRTDLLDSDSGPSYTSHGRLSPHAPGVLNDKNAIRMHQTCPERNRGGEAWKKLRW